MAQTIPIRKFTYYFFLWCIGWVILQTFALQYTFEFGWSTSLADAAVTNLVIAVLGYDIMLVMKYYNPRKIIRTAMTIGLAVIGVFAIHHIILMIIEATPEYSDFLDRSLVIRGLYIWLMVGLATALTGLWFLGRESQEAEDRRAAAEKLAREAELSRLRQQLQPHFLFNSLNSISALAGSDPEEARKMIHQLSDFFRGVLRKDSQQLIPLAEELDHLSLYLAIEKVRFGHRLSTVVECQPEALVMKLPSLLLQPVVENAIKFGLYDTLGQTNISIRAIAEDNYLKVTIENPFDQAFSAAKPGTGFGLSSIQRRLHLLYARSDLLTTSGKDNIFTTQIKIPQIT